ncbi:MAG TPA: hypothetical protein VFA32_14740 [Dehalococcoidia bacterium]|nr:hypothetical protein [Dehalococcoidia bacterium]
MNLRVVETVSWPDVETAATAAQTCIRPGGLNHAVAKETWEAGKVRYWIQELQDKNTFKWSVTGYVRLHRITERSIQTLAHLWIVDFCAPFNYRAIRLVGQQLSEPLLVHSRGADDDDLSAGWLALTLKLPTASSYKFHQCQGVYESKWLVVS